MYTLLVHYLVEFGRQAAGALAHIYRLFLHAGPKIKLGAAKGASTSLTIAHSSSSSFFQL